MADPSPSRTNWPAVLLIWLAGCAAAAQFAKISVSFPLLEAEYPAAVWGIGIIVSAVGFAGLLGGASAGIVIARLGPARMLIAALLFGAALSAIEAILPPYPLLLLLRVAEGLSHVTIVVAGPTLIAAVAAPRDQGSVMAIWATFFGVGFAIAGWLGVPLSETYGVGALFLAHSAAMAGLAGLLWWIGLPRLPRAEAGARGWIAAHVAIYRRLNTALPGLIFLWHTLSYVALLTLLPGFGPEGSRALLAGLLPLSGLAGTFSAMALVRVGMSLRLIAIAGFGGAALLAVIAAPWVSEPLFLLMAPILTFFSGFVPAAAFALVPTLNADAPAQARANGAVAQLGNLGSVSGTPILAAVIAGFGFSGLVLLTLFFMGAGCLVTLLGLRATAAKT